MNKTVHNNFRNNKFSAGGSVSNETKRHNFKKGDHRRTSLECIYCYGTNDTRGRCFYLIGFPPRKTVVNSGKVVVQMSTLVSMLLKLKALMQIITLRFQIKLETMD